jgi:hypothetical protein
MKKFLILHYSVATWGGPSVILDCAVMFGDNEDDIKKTYLTKNSMAGNVNNFKFKVYDLDKITIDTFLPFFY